MAFMKPFTPQQRREAVEAYRSYRRHRSLLRQLYPPVNAQQKQIFAHYADAIDATAAALRPANAAVDVNALNRADALAKWLAADYWRARSAN